MGSTGAMPAAERALEHLAKYGSSGGDRASMLRAYDRAIDAEHEGRHVEARAAYLEAWAHFRPNPQALVRAGRVARRAGDAAGAQRLHDRALSELAKRPRAAAIALDEHQQGSADVRWLGGERAFSIYQNGFYQLFDSKTLELLATYRRSPPWTIFSDDGRRLATSDFGEHPKLHVFHAHSGHTLFSSPLEAEASTLVAKADLSLIATTGGDAVEVFDPNAGRRVARFTAKGRAHHLRFVREDILFGAFDHDKLLLAWDLAKGGVLWQRTFDPSPFAQSSSSHGDRIAGIAMPDPRSKTKAARMVLLDLRTGKLTETSIAGDARRVAFAGPELLVVFGPKQAAAHRADTLARLATLALDDKSSADVSHERPGTVVIVTGAVRRTWDPKTGKIDAHEPRSNPKQTPELNE